MKSIHILTTLFAAVLALSPTLHAHEEGPAKKAGPNGGRVITAVEPHAEFFVTPEKKVRITFLTEDGKPVAKDGAEISLVGGDRANPTKLNFVKEGDAYVSDKPLPEGQNLPVIVKIKAGADAKQVTEKFGLNLADCSECKHKEYACTCAHGH